MNVMKKSRILIAEDERDLAGILRDTLVTLDFAVTLAHDGASALEAYAAERPDLLVTDVDDASDGWFLPDQTTATGGCATAHHRAHCAHRHGRCGAGAATGGE